VAKKKAAKRRPRQRRIPGTTDPAVAAVQDKAWAYAEACSSAKSLQAEAKTLHAQLVELMERHDIEEGQLDEAYKFSLKRTPEAVKVNLKTLKNNDEG
jgi:hypothetical protein